MAHNNAESDAQSPYVRPWHRWPDRGGPRKRKRLIWFCFFAAFALAAILPVWFRALPKRHVGYLLYWLHDQVYLPFVGYTWTLEYPLSLVWWALAAVALVVSLIGFLTPHSAIGRIHESLCRRTIRLFAWNERFIRALVAAVDFFARFHLNAELLAEVVRLERFQALLAVVRAEPGGPDARRKVGALIRLTRLLADLQSHPGASDLQRVWALVHWHQAMLWSDRRLDSASARKLAPEMEEQLSGILARGLASPSAGASHLHRSSLIADLLLLSRGAAAPEERQASLLAQVAVSVADRLSEIKSVLEHLEDIRGARDRARVPVIGEAEETLAPIGVLSIGIALHLASRSGVAGIALEYLDAFAALRLAARIAEPEARANAIEMARRLTAEAPWRDQYQFCRELAAEALRGFEEAAGARGLAAEEEKEIVSLEQASIASLGESAGPEFGGTWHPQTRSIEGRIRWRLRNRPLTLRQRLDPILATGCLVAGLSYLALSAGLVSYGATQQWFERWTIEPIADDRILENVRDGLVSKPLLDAAYHGPDGRIYISQTGGAIHAYSPATHLWTTERPFQPTDLSDPEIRWLSSTPDSSLDGEGGAARLWGVTARGGLVRRRAGRWEVAIGDSRFVGLNGNPVEHSELTSVAISADESWLVAGTISNGADVYDLRRRRWLSKTEIASRDMPREVRRAVWWGDRFWLGGSQGVAQLDMRRQHPSFERVASLDGTVLDLDATPHDGLWVLQRRTCGNGPADCLRLAKLTAPGADPVPIIEEGNHYGRIDLSRFFFAEQWNGRLVLAGLDGIFDYDPRLHSWHRRFAAGITALAPCQGRSCFYFGFQNGAGLFSPANLKGEKVPTWDLKGETPLRIAVSPKGTALALMLSGAASALAPGEAARSVFAASSSRMPPNRFERAFAMGEDVLLVGPSGALLHNVATRSYQSFTDVPAWVRSQDSVILTSDSGLYALTPVAGAYSARALTLDQIRSGDFTPTAEPAHVAGPIRDSAGAGPGNPLFIDGQGRVASFQASGIAYLTGPRDSGMEGARIRDVADSEGGLLVSTDRGVREYASQSRSFGDYLNAPLGESPREIARFGLLLLARSDANRLIALGAKPEVVIGKDTFLFPDERLSDVRIDGGNVYLAGAGAIQRYNTETRRIDGVWPLDTLRREDVQLRAIVGGEPVSLSSGVARRGTRELATEVHDLFVDSSEVWVVTGPPGRRFLQAIPLAATAPARGTPEAGTNPAGKPQAACWFRNPTAGTGVTELHDARQLPDGLIAATTNGGLRLYSRERGSWYATELDPALGRGDIYRIGDYLMAADPAGRPNTLTVFQVAGIPADSCSPGAAVLKRSPETIPIRSLAVDENAGRAIFVRTDGAVVELKADGQKELLPTPEAGPRAEEIARTWSFPDVAPNALWLATRTDLWRYELNGGQWKRIAVSLEGGGPLPPDASLDLQPQGSYLQVVAKSSAADFYSGSLDIRLNRLPASLSLKPLLNGSSFGASGDDIVDVQQDGSNWTFLLRNGLRGFDPETRTWSTEAAFDGRDRIVSRGRIGGSEVIAARSGKGRTVWLIRQASGYVRYEHRDGDRTALGARGEIFRLDASASLQRCAAGRGDRWTCATTSVPVHLSPGEVRQAFGWRRTPSEPYALVLFETANRLLAYSPANGAEVPLGPAATGFRIAAVRSQGGNLWVRGGDRLLILSQPAGQAVRMRARSGVLDLAVDDRQQMWARFADGWRVWRNEGEGEFEAVRPNGKTRLLVQEGAPAAGLDDAGNLYAPNPTATKFVPTPGRLPAEIPPSDVQALLAGAAGEWWAVWDHRLGRLVAGNCAAPTAGPQHPALCMQVQELWSLPAAFDTGTQGLAAWKNGVELLSGNGLRFRVAPGDRQVLPAGSKPAATGELANQAPEFQSWFSRAPDGQWVLDGISGLQETPQGLFADRPSGSFQVAAHGGLALVENPALDAGWLRWDRTAQAFWVRTRQGNMRHSKQDFVRDRKFPFEGVEAVRIAGPSQCYAATAFGIWDFSQRCGGLAARDVRFIPVDWSLPLDSMGGRFRAPGGEYLVVDGRLDRRAPSATFAIGAVTYFREVRHGLVAVLQTLDGRNLAAYRSGKFLWDSGRKGVSLTGEDLLLESAAGIFSLADTAAFDPGPPGKPDDSDMLASVPGLPPRFLRAGKWYERTAPGIWNIARPLPASRVLFSDDRWKWTGQSGSVQIEYADGTRMRNAAQPGSGVGFSFDALVDAARYGGRLFVVTAAFVDIHNSPPGVLPLERAARLPAPVADRLEAVSEPGHGERLLLTGGATVREWDSESNAFKPVPPAADPYRERLLAESGRLRFTLRHGAIEKQLLVRDARGKSHWASFRFDGGRFPFDVVRALAASNGKLFLGTSAGLQIYGGGSLELSGADIFDMGGGGGKADAAIRIGEPCDAPGTLVAVSPERCFRVSKNGGFESCHVPDPLACRALVRTRFWSWWSDAAGVSGRYRIASAPPGTAPRNLDDAVDLAGGRFPHDEITQVRSFGQEVFAVWRGNHVSVHHGDLHLDPGIQTYAFSGRVRLIAVPDPIPLDRRPDSELPAGMYLQEEGRTWRYAGSGWTEVRDTSLIEAVAQYDRDPPVLQRRRLRLATGNRSRALSFELRMPGGDWQTVPWRSAANLSGDRLSIDVWQNLAFDGDTLWAVTPDGLVSVRQGERFDPDSFRFIAGPPAEAGNEVTDILVRNGRAILRFEGRGDRIYEGRLDEKSGPVLFSKRSGGDPFSEKDMNVDVKYWRWRMVGRTGRKPGILVATWKGEPVRLDNGRFDFDGINSIALFGGQLHLGTDSRGWFRAPVDSAALADISRPRQNAVNSLEVTKLWPAREKDKGYLCLEEGSGATVRLGVDGAHERTQGCPLLLGESGLWRYQADGAKVSILPRKSTGRAGERTLVGGQFTDDVVLGPPVTGERGDRQFTLLPTEAGIVRFDSELRPREIIGPPFQQKNQTPRGVYIAADGKPLYEMDRDLFALEGAQVRAYAWNVDMDSTAVLNRIEGGPNRLMRFDWSSGNARHHTVIDPQNPQASLRDTAVIDARDLPQFIWRRVKMDQPEGWLKVEFAPGAFQARAGSGARVPIHPGKLVEILEWIRWQDRLMLICRSELLEISLGAVVARSSAQTSSGPPD